MGNNLQGLLLSPIATQPWFIAPTSSFTNLILPLFLLKPCPLTTAVSYPQTLFTRISFLVFSLRVGCWWANRSLIVFVTFGAPKIYARLVSPISTPFFWPLLKSSFPPLDPDFRFYALLPVLSNVLLRLAYPFLYPTLSILRL